MSSEYTEQSFWEKVQAAARTAGREVIEKALWLYYTAADPKTPSSAKAVIYGALAYFILPVDAIPDVIPMVGFADDLGAITAVIHAVTTHITDDIKSKAQERLATWFN